MFSSAMGANSAPLNLLAGFEGPLQAGVKRRERRRRKGKRKGRKKDGRDGRTHPPHLRNKFLVTALCSGEEHMKVDVDAVHRRICHLLAVIRSPSHVPAFLSIEKAATLAKQRKNQQLVQTQ